MTGHISSTAPFKSALVRAIVAAKEGLVTVPAAQIVEKNSKEVTKCVNTEKKGDCATCAMTVCPAQALMNRLTAH